jgi:hypothetical protein
MPADNGFRAHADDRVEHRAEGASGESEQHAVSCINSGLWHGTTRDDDLLTKDGVFDKKSGVDRKAERNALMTVLKTSTNIAAKNLARDDQPRNPRENCSGSTSYRIFAAHMGRSVEASGLPM